MELTLLLVIIVAVMFGFKPARRAVISAPVMKIMTKVLPSISETEDVALKAGTVFWDGDIFSGKPDWNKLLNFKIKTLSKEEQAFLDGPVEKLCEMLDDWEISQNREMPKAAWDHIKKHKFFGMIIPKAHGGLGFSAAAHSAVVTKVSSRSVAAAVTIMVPNSLGPGELLLHYGTKAQQKYYLPKLAKGEEIPCFALTEPHAGSDAANGRSAGIVCKGMHEGKQVLGIKVSFKKRYITLAPVATVVGLAFRLYDPEGLLGSQEDIGITCALLPHTTKGLDIGRRHDPMGIAFPNGPVEGTDVFIPMDYVIGGKAGVGKGWKMLMECLSAGRGISLPSLSVGAAELSTRATTAYATVREQFGMPIGKFEGVREQLGRTAAAAYYMNATRRLTVGAVDAGEKPAVASAIAKAYLTDGMRQCLNDGMDIHAGSAICRGPQNIFARAYQSIPIGITVEGANILTRSMIVFGQGAIRCHPFVQKEVEAIQNKDLNAFDDAFFGHVKHIIVNTTRAKLLAFSHGYLATPPVSGKEARAYQHLNRLSAAFALVAEICLLTLGGALKRKEYISGRLADAFAWQYMASSALKQFYDDGAPERDRAVLEWTLTHALHQTEQGLIGVLRNLPNRPVAWLVRLAIFPLGTTMPAPTDKQLDALVDAATSPSAGLREKLSAEIYIPDAKSPGLGEMEDAFTKIVAATAARNKVNGAYRKGVIEKSDVLSMAKAASKAGIINADEFILLETAEIARDKVVQVSAFSAKDYKQLK